IVRLLGYYPYMRHLPTVTDEHGRFELATNTIPDDVNSKSGELAWNCALNVFDPIRPISKQLDLHFNHPDSYSNITIKLQPESFSEFLEGAFQGTIDRTGKPATEQGKTDAELTSPDQLAPELKGATWFNTEQPSPSLADFRGKYVLLVFWAVWCGPCHHDFPEVKLINETYKDHGLVVIGFHDNSADAASVGEHAKQQGLTFPIAVDQRDGRILDAYNESKLVNVYPTYLLISPDGKLIERDRFSLAKFETIRKYLFAIDHP
ncbi:MAG TPA: TlpA disulfide reductase family protein, partial [Pirellulales bacterium]